MYQSLETKVNTVSNRGRDLKDKERSEILQCVVTKAASFEER